MSRLLVNFISDDSGATSIEYALIGALIGLAIILGAGGVGETLNARFDQVSTKAATPPAMTAKAIQ